MGTGKNMLFRFFANYFDRILFVFGILFFAFVYGVAVGKYQIFPYEVLNNAKDAVEDWRENWEANLAIQPKHITDTSYRGPALARFDPARAYEGVNLVPSFIKDSVGLKLVNMKGETLHQWMVSLNGIWKDSSHFLHGPMRDWDVQVDDAVLYPDGDVVIVMSHAGMARLDRCGKVKWKVDRAIHHAVHQDGDGNLWAIGTRISDAGPRLPKLVAPIEEEYLIEVSETGEILREISILDTLYESGLHALLFMRPLGFHPADSWEITHANDVEILGADMAAAFPQFEAGDIMFSARTLSLVAVLDGKTEKVKWYQVGPFFRQHDPDFQPDGRITVFDNQTDVSEGTVFGGSRVVAVDPVTRNVSVLYKGTETDPFYSNEQGAHQILPNGNILITESTRGRVFEVAPDGDIVWEFRDMWGEEQAISPARVQRYPVSYSKFVAEKCS